MKKIALFIIIVFEALLAIAQNRVVETVDYTPYCGTWQYENKDTTFTVSFKVATLKMYETSTQTISRKILVGGYRLIVKGKFDDNYLTTSKIPSVLNVKIPRELNYEGPVPKYSVYVEASGAKGETELDGSIYNQTKNHKYDWIPGFAIKILPNGKMQWHWSKKQANMYAWDDPLQAEFIQIPGHAIMTKIK